MYGRPAGWRVLADRARLGRPGSRLPVRASVAGLGGGISWRPPAYSLLFSNMINAPLPLLQRLQNRSIIHVLVIYITAPCLSRIHNHFNCVIANISMPAPMAGALGDNARLRSDVCRLSDVCRVPTPGPSREQRGQED